MAVALANGYTSCMAGKPQFSLRWIFFLTAAVALLLGEAVGFPELVALVVALVVTSLLPPAFVAGIVYADGYGRAFCIGVLAWWIVITWRTDGFPVIGRDFQIVDGGRLDYCMYWLWALSGGLVAVVVRWLSARKSSSD